MPICSFLRLACFGICLLAPGCGDNHTDELIAKLQDTDPDIRRLAVSELADSEGDQVVVALATVADDSNTDVRRLAINALGQRGTQAAAQLPSILPALEDSQLSVRLASALAIQSIDPNSEAFVPVLVEALRAGEGGIFLKVAEMGPNAEWAVQTLIQLLSHPEVKIRRLTAITLGQLGPTARDATSAIKRAQNDPEEVVRNAAQQALQQINSTPDGE